MVPVAKHASLLNPVIQPVTWASWKDGQLEHFLDESLLQV